MNEMTKLSDAESPLRASGHCGQVQHGDAPAPLNNETMPDQVHMRANGTLEEKMLIFILKVKKYTAPWAVDEVKHPEVFRKAMINIHEHACKVLKDTGYAE